MRMQLTCELMGGFGMVVLTAVLQLLVVVESVEMTFELPDAERMCFHETINTDQKGVNCVLEFQVIEGGNYDVDVTLVSPSGASLYTEQKKQFDRYGWTADEVGEYKFCFSNEFSTFTHKMVYFDFQVGEDDALQPQAGDPITAMTQLETTVRDLHLNLNTLVEYQTHLRLRESLGRSFAEDLNERVQVWSVGQSVVILLAGIGQIVILRSFFSEHKR